MRQKIKLLTFIACITLTMVGCAKAKKSSTPASPPPFAQVPPNGQPWVPPTNGPGQGPGTSWQYGDTVPLVLVNLGLLEEYAGGPRNNPTNIVLNVNLRSFADDDYSGIYGGTMSIKYYDNATGYNVLHTGYFTSGSTSKANKYNIWFDYQNQPVFHAVFEDYLGAVVLVIDEFVDLGDGTDVTEASGTVWFKNFGLTYAPHPPTNCWFVSTGPYDCRPWPSGNGMSTTKSVNPQAGFKKLGSFTGLKLNQAFNDDLTGQ